MKQWIFYLLLVAIILIAGCTKSNNILASTTTIQIPETTAITNNLATTTSIMPDVCPDIYKRHDSNGNIYCPDKKLFGCVGMTWDECSKQVLDDIWTTTTSSTTSTTIILEAGQNGSL